MGGDACGGDSTLTELMIPEQRYEEEKMTMSSKLTKSSYLGVYKGKKVINDKASFRIADRPCLSPVRCHSLIICRILFKRKHGVDFERGGDVISHKINWFCYLNNRK